MKRTLISAIVVLLGIGIWASSTRCFAIDPSGWKSPIPTPQPIQKIGGDITGGAKKLGGQASDQWKGATNNGSNAARGFTNNAANAGRTINNNAINAANSARAAASRAGNYANQGIRQQSTNLGNAYNGARAGATNTARGVQGMVNGGARQFNNAAGNNFGLPQIRVPQTNLPPVHNWDQGLGKLWQDGSRGVQQGASDVGRGWNQARDTVGRGYVDGRDGVQNFARQSASDIGQGAAGIRTQGQAFYNDTAEGVRALPQDTYREVQKAVVTVQHVESKVRQQADTAVRQAAATGNTVVQTGVNVFERAAAETAAGTNQVVSQSTRTLDEVFQQGAILGNQAVSDGQEAVRQGEVVVNDGFKVFEQAAREADNAHQQLLDAQERLEELQAKAREAEQIVKGVEADYHKIMSGDREDLLEVLEERTGKKLGGDARDQFLEADFNTAIAKFEEHTGVDVPDNLEARVAQAQALGEAFRTGEIDDVTKAAGAESNRDEVRAEKEKGWDGVAYGEEINHETYIEVGGAAAASVIAANPAPLIAYCEEWAAKQYATLKKNLLKEGKAALLEKFNEKMLADAMQSAMQGNPVKLPITGIDIEVGMATYNHRAEISGGVPELTSKGIEINQHGTEVSLPNTHQPYVRFKFDD